MTPDVLKAIVQEWKTGALQVAAESPLARVKKQISAALSNVFPGRYPDTPEGFILYNKEMLAGRFSEDNLRKWFGTDDSDYRTFKQQVMAEGHFLEFAVDHSWMSTLVEEQSDFSVIGVLRSGRDSPVKEHYFAVQLDITDENFTMSVYPFGLAVSELGDTAPRFREKFRFDNDAVPEDLERFLARVAGEYLAMLEVKGFTAVPTVRRTENYAARPII